MIILDYPTGHNLSMLDLKIAGVLSGRVTWLRRKKERRPLVVIQIQPPAGDFEHGERCHLSRSVGRLTGKVETALSGQTARHWGSQSYNCKKLNSSNNLSRQEMYSPLGLPVNKALLTPGFYLGEICVRLLTQRYIK